MAGTAVVTIAGKTWTVDVATTASELIDGLSGVASIPVDTGMLFDMGSEGILTVNAYEMLFSLSVVFIDEDLKVTEVALLLAPGDDGTTTLPCRYFLEVNVGEADDVDIGDTVVITGYTPPTPSVPVDTGSILEMILPLMMVVMMMKMMSGMMKETTGATTPRPSKPVRVAPGSVPVGFAK